MKRSTICATMSTTWHTTLPSSRTIVLDFSPFQAHMTSRPLANVLVTRIAHTRCGLQIPGPKDVPITRNYCRLWKWIISMVKKEGQLNPFQYFWSLEIGQFSGQAQSELSLICSDPSHPSTCPYFRFVSQLVKFHSYSYLPTSISNVSSLPGLASLSCPGKYR